MTSPETTQPPRGADLRCLAIVPAFNESGSVRRVVASIKRELPHFDILVIDDGSVDSTVYEVPEYARLVSLPFNLGIGGAMQTGYRYAALHDYDIAVQVDADGQHPPKEIQKLLDVLLGDQSLTTGGDSISDSPPDLVIGSRFVSTTAYRQTVGRMVGIHVLRHLIKLFGRIWITDPTSGFRAANKRVIRAFAHWYPDDYPEPEVILLLHRAGFKVTEVQVDMEQRTSGVTSIPFVRGLFYVIKVGTCLALDMCRDPWPMEKLSRPDVESAVPRPSNGNGLSADAPPSTSTERDAAAHADATPSAIPEVKTP